MHGPYKLTSMGKLDIWTVRGGEPVQASGYSSGIRICDTFLCGCLPLHCCLV